MSWQQQHEFLGRDKGPLAEKKSPLTENVLFWAKKKRQPKINHSKIQTKSNIDAKNTFFGNQTRAIVKTESSTPKNINRLELIPSNPETKSKYSKVDAQSFVLQCARCGKKTKPGKQLSSSVFFGSSYCYVCTRDICKCSLRCIHFPEYHDQKGSRLFFPSSSRHQSFDPTPKLDPINP
ncbi:hypothetical protein BB559_001590 [Furculomyces boomerangus]|uniref:Uncharacterized protein n=1 Tax=Furculomyces boomerangus TaxID=61424 RepID=A0A2T9Z1J6_9FUNG|nr:hypothetical protein BB559_001590 [Furculomyces boomerangus]